MAKTVYIFIIAMAWLLPCISIAQTNLSRDGAAHLRAAETLKSMAASIDDKLQVAEEYEKVTQSNPNYADAYLEAARIYSALTPEVGNTAYQKAKTLFLKYANLRPKEASEIDADLIVLEAMLKKYANGPTKLDGTWGEIGRKGHFYPCAEIKHNGYGYDVKFIGDLSTSSGYTKDVQVNVNGTLCSIIVQTFHDNRPALRTEGWSSYYDDCDGDADPGFPRSGRYHYNETLTTWHYNIDLSKTPLEMKCEKIHHDYYLNGSNTYSDTKRNVSLFDKKLVKK